MNELTISGKFIELRETRKRSYIIYGEKKNGEWNGDIELPSGNLVSITPSSYKREFERNAYNWIKEFEKS